MIALWLALLGCGPAPCGEGLGRDNDGRCVTLRGSVMGDSADTGHDEIAEHESLPAPRLLRRLSLDLRGVLPSTDELDAVEADASLVWDYRDGWLDDPRLEERLVALLAERWHTTVDDYLIHYFEYPEFRDRPDVEYTFERALGEEPLRLIARIVVDDRPWTDVVLADHSMGHDLLAEIWPMDYPEGAEGWQEVRYTDGRPAAGVLSTNGLWWRYYTTDSNLSRGRAAALTRLLACEDFLSRPISISAADDGGSLGSVLEEPGCVSCHSTLDPLAAALFGFYPINPYNGPENSTYHLEREPLGSELLGVAPAWFGIPVNGLEDLAWQIANDERFISCGVESFTEAFWRRELAHDEPEDRARVAVLREAFVVGELRVRPLLAAITDHPVYSAGASSDPADDTRRLLSPDQVATVAQDLSGFTWEADGFDLMRSDTTGYRIMAGGVDGLLVTRAQVDPGLTAALVWQRVAEGVAAGLVDQGAVPVDARPGDATFEDTLEAFFWRVMARRPTAEETDALAALFDEVLGLESAEIAWQAVLSAVLRDPEAVTR